MTDLSGHRSRHGVDYDDHGVRDAVRAGLGFAAAGLLFLLTASLWMSTCTGSTFDALACGAPQRAGAAAGAPLILLAGAVWSLLRGARVRREAPAWWAWQGAGWTLLVLTAVSVVVALP